MSKVQRLSQQLGSTHVTYLAHDFREPLDFGNVADNDNESDEDAYERVKLHIRRNDFWVTALNIAAFMVAFAAAGVIYHG